MTHQIKQIPIIVTTSNRYLHLIPVFTYLMNKHWPNQEVTLLGYEQPADLPENFTFVSMGKQGTVNEWSTDIRRHIESIEDVHFIWMMEDTLIKGVNDDALNIAYALACDGIGRVDLSCDLMKREHTVDPVSDIAFASQTSRYRLSTQPSIWNRGFLLQYLQQGMSPWEFETQDPMNDGWHVVCPTTKALSHNEGVNKRDIYKLDLNGFGEEDILEINKIVERWKR